MWNTKFSSTRLSVFLDRRFRQYTILEPVVENVLCLSDTAHAKSDAKKILARLTKRRLAGIYRRE